MLDLVDGLMILGGYRGMRVRGDGGRGENEEGSVLR